nr:class I adenylate-forming enzyme family protein [Bordetella sp. BOR01]
MARRRREESLELPETLGEFVRERAALMGERVAAVWFDQQRSLTYRELDVQANRLADSLMALGVRKGSHVALMLGNSPAFPLSWVALGRLGAVMVPVNTAYTEEEIQFVLSDSDAQYLIVDAAFLPRIQAMRELPPLLDAGRIIVHGAAHDGPRWEDLVEQGRADFVSTTPVARTDLLNLQYTSGTTGFPKGCMLSHDYWMIHANNSARHRRSAEGGIENVLIWAPFFYMDPMWQFLMTLKLGGTAYIADRMSLTRFMDWLVSYRIHYCIFPEPALSQHPASERDAQVQLRYVSIYGWTESARREVRRRFNVVAREGYGMTEIGTGSLVPAWADDKAILRTCGLPMVFREFQICDEAGQPVSDGEAGELCVAGRGIFWGYYKRPQANAESFRGRWFRTGDIFRRDDDGFYYLVGRIKEMIKRAGENIAANEVEAVLRSLDGIEEAAVVPVPDPLRREEVKAYLKLRQGLTRDDLPPERVFEHCTRHLAAFKVPRYLQYMVDDFPRTPSRKIAKKTLIAQVQDPLAGVYDRQEARWR